jgi:regulatory protein YycH of two-component signal transduction system YycFG
LNKNKKNRELETTFNSFKKTTTSVTTLTPQMIFISKEEEEVEILSQLIVEKQLEQAPEPRLVEKEELQQPMKKDNGKEFLKKIFEEELVCSVIHQRPRLRTKAMMKRKSKAPIEEHV